MTAEFRCGPTNPKESYEKWEERQPLPDGHRPDLITHALIRAPENYSYANAFAEANPDTLFLSTWRAASGTPLGVIPAGDKLEMSNISFPGHWVLSPGSTLSAELVSTAQTMAVASATKFAKGPALLVETDASGAKLWERFEYVLITQIQGTTLTVQRAYNGSPPARTFPANRTYVAPIPWDGRATESYNNWFFNITAKCPLDKDGKTALDVLLDPMLGPLKPGGVLEHIGGLDLASGPLGGTPDNADYDGDGAADPDSIYQDGIKAFYERVRSVLGPDRVLTTSLHFESLGFVNGVNQEGLVKPRDPWREVSSTVNSLLAWERLSPLPRVSLAFVQYMNAEEELRKVQMHRLLNGYSVCLGMAADVELGDGVEALTRIELFKGEENEAHWLGRARGAMKRPAAMTPNLLGGGGGTDWDGMQANIVATKGSLVRDGNELVLRPQQDGNATLVLNFNLSERSDFTVFFEARSEDGQISRDISLPTVSVPVETGPVRATITSLDYLPLSFYVRGAQPGSVTMDFRFDDGGDVRFRSLSVHAAPDTLACEFEKGVVLVNPSLGDVSMDLAALFPGRTGFRRLRMPPLQGDIPAEYMPQYEQAVLLNSGEMVEAPTSVVVPERNALFLVAE